MVKRRRWIQWGAMVVAMAGVLLIHGAQGNEADDGATMEIDRAQDVLTLVGFVNQFRMDAIRNIDMALQQWATPEFMNRWDAHVLRIFQKPEMIMWEDFFSGSIVWAGTMGEGEGIAGLYSPWCDALLILRVRIAGAESRLTDFRIVSGEALRNEPIPTEAVVQKTLRLYVGSEPPTLALARLYADSLEAFEAAFPEEGNLDLLPDRLSDRAKTNTEEAALIKGRMIYRLHMFRELLGEQRNSRFHAETGRLLRIIESGESERVRAAFSSDQAPEPVDSLLEISEDIRAAMTVSFFGRKGADAVVGLISPVAPKWVFMVLMEENEAENLVLTMEMLDLEASAQVLDLVDQKGAQ